MTLPYSILSVSAPTYKAPSDEGAVSEADWGRDLKLPLSHAVRVTAPLTRGAFWRCRAVVLLLKFGRAAFAEQPPSFRCSAVAVTSIKRTADAKCATGGVLRGGCFSARERTA